jgi:hypothetical protein
MCYKTDYESFVAKSHPLSRISGSTRKHTHTLEHDLENVKVSKASTLTCVSGRCKENQEHLTQMDNALGAIWLLQKSPKNEMTVSLLSSDRMVEIFI